MKKSNIQQIDEGLLVKVPAGKTGERMVVVVEATKFVNAWLDAHPIKDNDAPLWYYIRKNWGKESKKVIPKDHREGALTQAGIAKRIRCVVERMNEYRRKNGMPKFATDINPHNFRHSRATELGGENGMTEQILCKVFGWEIGSAMPRTYLHLTDDQVRRAVLRTYGKTKKDDDAEIITSWTCSRCKEDVPLALNYCGRCGSSKDGKVISKTTMLEEKVSEMERQLARLLKTKLEAKK